MVSIGEKIDMLTVIKEVQRPVGSKDLHKFFLCQCDCGNTTIASSGNIGRGVKSCGCARKNGVYANRKHGFASHKRYDKLYHTWNAMKSRCYNKNGKDYKHYGDRGIKVCDEWLSDFMAFRAWAISH